MKKLFIIIKALYYFMLGNIIAFLRYDKKYLKGKYFEGKLKGMGAVGWKWVVTSYFGNKRLQINCDVPWPVSPRTTVIGAYNIKFHHDDLNNFQSSGCYYQGVGKIIIGQGTFIAPNVGIITANHNINKLDEHAEPKGVIIGKNCWIGMNSIILPGVILGDNTVVGAGSVVTKEFFDGYCVIAGNPAKIIKHIEIS